MTIPLEPSGLPTLPEERRWAFWRADPKTRIDPHVPHRLSVRLGDVAVFHGKNWYCAREKAAAHFGVEPGQLQSRPAWKETS